MKSKYRLQCFEQVLIYLIEVIGISAIAVAVSAHFVPIHDFIKWLQRWLVFYAIYQVLVIVIATNINDIHKDSWLAAKNAYQMASYYYQTHDKKILPDIEHRISQAIGENTILLPKAREKILELKNHEAGSVERGLIEIDHQLSVCELKWKYSLILRFFK